MLAEINGHVFAAHAYSDYKSKLKVIHSLYRSWTFTQPILCDPVTGFITAVCVWISYTLSTAAVSFKQNV